MAMIYKGGYQIPKHTIPQKEEKTMTTMEKTGLAIVGIIVLTGLIWLSKSENPNTPPGYVGYVTQGAVFGQTQFLTTQTGPSSYGRTWMADVINVSVTPFTYEEQFDNSTAILSKDSVKIRFAVHIIWKVKNDTESIRSFVEKYSTLKSSHNPDDIVRTAYENYVREPLRTAARNELQQFEALAIKDNIVLVGKTVESQIKTLCQNTPFDVIQVVVGNIQYPDAVANAVADKMAAIQKLEQVTTDAKRRIAEAEGISQAMNLVQAKLTPLYLQHEAIEAQKLMVGSPNHTTIYIPVGNNGVPIVSTVPNPPQDNLPIEGHLVSNPPTKP